MNEVLVLGTATVMIGCVRPGQTSDLTVSGPAASQLRERHDMWRAVQLMSCHCRQRGTAQQSWQALTSLGRDVPSIQTD